MIQNIVLKLHVLIKANFTCLGDTWCREDWYKYSEKLCYLQQWRLVVGTLCYDCILPWNSVAVWHHQTMMLIDNFSFDSRYTLKYWYLFQRTDYQLKKRNFKNTLFSLIICKFVSGLVFVSRGKRLPLY